MFDLQYQLKMLPDKPGVYIMKNSLGEVIYVGKAKILKNRVKQYFQNSKNHSEKVRIMVKHIEEFEYIVTDTEMEALILECNLIKKYRPHYNILLKDDKQYPYLKVTTKEDFPRVFITRNIVKDGNKYFGPYTDLSALYETIDVIKKVFPIRTCRKNIIDGVAASRPCLNYHIGLCKAPCDLLISKEDYKLIVKDILDLLGGKDINIIKALKDEMFKAAENLEFEKAAELRNKIISVEKIQEKQKIIVGQIENDDYINLYKDEFHVVIQVFFMREGKIMGREHFFLENKAYEEDSVLLSEFIREFYGGTAFVPKNVYLPKGEDLELLEEWLTMKRGSKAHIKVPQKGDKKETLNLVEKNAKATLEQFQLKLLKDKIKSKNIMEDIAETLELEELPHRIESFDISNIFGVDSVGGMIVFEDGKPKNSDYRRFKIKTVVGANDYDSMREILTRRFKRGLDEVKAIASNELSLSKGKFSVFPDLILMDGGKGQVNIALEVLEDLNINVPVAGLVKDDKHRTRGIIYNNKEIVLKKSSELMHFITRLQDEVHRFAISYHRSLHDKNSFKSLLDDIKGVGEKRKKNLMLKFGSIENIKKASLRELMETPAMDVKSAESVKNYFMSKSK